MKRTFLMIAFAALATIAYSQTDDKGYEEGKYVLKGVSGLNLSQTAMTNWSAGGENSVAGNAYLNGSLTHKNGNWLWVTNLVLDYGLTKTKSQGMRKSTDKIGLSTQLGYSTNNVWFYTLMGDQRIQLSGQGTLYLQLFRAGLFQRLAGYGIPPEKQLFDLPLSRFSKNDFC